MSDELSVIISIFTSIVTGIISSIFVSIIFMNIQNKIQSYNELFDCTHHYWYLKRYFENEEDKKINLEKARKDLLCEYDKLGHILTIKLERDLQGVGIELFKYMDNYLKSNYCEEKNIKQYFNQCGNIINICSDYRKKIWRTSIKDTIKSKYGCILLFLVFILLILIIIVL